jgi:hypothetical protein
MSGTAQREAPHVGIFWVVQAEPRLLAAGCPLDQAEPYGDCLTYGPGHYETWAQWRRDRTVEPGLRALVRSYEYEDWPRGRIVFDRSRDLFVLYASNMRALIVGRGQAGETPRSIAGAVGVSPGMGLRQTLQPFIRTGRRTVAFPSPLQSSSASLRHQRLPPISRIPRNNLSRHDSYGCLAREARPWNHATLSRRRTNVVA